MGGYLTGDASGSRLYPAPAVHKAARGTRGGMIVTPWVKWFLIIGAIIIVADLIFLAISHHVL